MFLETLPNQVLNILSIMCVKRSLCAHCYSTVTLKAKKKALNLDQTRKNKLQVKDVDRDAVTDVS